MGLYDLRLTRPACISPWASLLGALSIHYGGLMAVFAAYGWPSDLSDDEILEKLQTLNLERIDKKSQLI